jgi:hypothetical protein
VVREDFPTHPGNISLDFRGDAMKLVHPVLTLQLDAHERRTASLCGISFLRCSLSRGLR